MTDQSENEVVDGVVPWDGFRQWVHCICVVTFDLEIGQAIEVVYPGDAYLSSVEKTNICYLAFPDSNSCCGGEGDMNFHFRIRRSSLKLQDSQQLYSERVPNCIEADPLYYYGFVHFRQRKDPTIPRGYYQKSLVLLTVLPLVQLFSEVVEIVVQSFFDMGEAAIEAACHHIDQWPAPIPGKLLSLPLIGKLLHARIPCRSDVPQRAIYSDSAALESITALHTVYEYDIYQNLICAVNHIQLLWELILLGEPLVVMGPSPAVCSQIVHSLISLIWPLRFFNDYRPFFTIHDSEFKEYTSKSGPPPNVILGVTNPFFTKTLQHYPHILRVGDANTGNIADAGKTFRKAWDGRVLDTKPGLYSQYRPYLTRDKGLYKKLSKSSQSPEVLNSILCRHFLEITQSFMIPLERYLSSLMPLKKHISPFKAVPQARSFDHEEFLKTLSDNGPSLTCGVQGDWIGLYRRFLNSANFYGWLRSRLDDVDRQLRAIHLDVLCSSEFSKDSISSRHDVEIVDLVLKIRDRLVEMDPVTQSDRRIQLQAQLSKVLSSVDDELKSLLLSNCGLRDTVE
uniref:UDENN domain-containing protein n=1 Tax=Steinernema glaseri TaxID=37863 RepID=A0A1I7ZM86_9BILA